MAYVKTDWQDTIKDAQGNVIEKGTPLNAAKLNKVEDALADHDVKVTQHEEKLTTVTEQLAQTNSQVSTIDSVKADKSEVNNLTITKADKTYVDSNISTLNTKINSQASGSPKGTYATLSALQTAFPTGNSNIYLVTADGKWYYWNGTVWTAGGVYQSTEIADKSIQVNKLAFMPVIGTKSKNLFNKASAIQGKYVSYLTGELANHATYYASDWIEVSPVTTYTRKSLTQMAFYDINKVYISGLDGLTGEQATFTTPENCHYIRHSIPNSTALQTEQIELGSISTDYVPFGGAIGHNQILPREKPNRVTVKSSGGDFTSIQTAIDSVTASRDNPCDIYIYPATYTEELVGRDWVNLIGMDRDSCIIQSLPTTGDTVKRDTLKCHFNMVVKNLTIKAENTKYCVHDDGIGEHTFVLENCVLDKKAVDNYGGAVGLGLKANQHFKIKNCIVRGDNWGVYFHNFNDQSANCTLEIENSRITGTNQFGLLMYSLGSNMSDLIILKGNKIVGGMQDMKVGRDINYGHNQDDLHIIAYGNELKTYAKSEGSNVPFVQPIVSNTVESIV